MSAAPADHPLPAPPHAPPAPPRVPIYRAALADPRGVFILAALALWFGAHVVVGVITARRLEHAALTGVPLPPRPDQPVWFSLPEMQLGVRALEAFGWSFLHSLAYQMIAGALFFAGLVVLLSARLRIIVTTFPPLFFVGAALFQCVAYAVYSPYWAQGNPFFTLLFGAFACFITWQLAPRNSGFDDLRRLARGLAREAVTNPVALVFGPIFAKDVRVLGRHRGTYLIRAGYPLALLALVSLVYIVSTRELNETSAGVERIQRLQEIAPSLALFIAWTQFIVLLFMAAALTSSAICDERRTRSLASLMTTPMNATQIVMGKLSSRLVQLLIIGLISLPFLLGIRVFGGLEAETVTAFIAISITATLLMASLGVLASIWSRKASSAVALAFFLFLLVTLGPGLVIIISSINTGGPPPLEAMALSAPMAMVINSIQASGGLGGPRIVIRDLWIANSVVNLAFAVVAVFLASVSLRSVMLSENALEAPKRKAKRASRRARAAAARSLPAGPDPANPEGATEAPAPVEVFVERDTTVSDNPVLWRELRQPTLGSRRMLIICSCVLVAALLWLYAETPPTEETPHAIVTIIGILVLTFQAAVSSTPSIANEKDATTWLTLLTTPLTGAQILIPKLIGAVRKLWFVAAIVVAELCVGLVCGEVHPILILHFLGVVVGTGIFLGGTGIFFSLIARRAALASLLNLGLGLALWAGLPILSALIAEFLLPPGSRLDAIFDAVMHINPIALVGVSMGASLRSQTFGMWNADFPTSNYNAVEYSVIVLVYAGVAAALGVAAVVCAASRFNRFAGRTS